MRNIYQRNNYNRPYFNNIRPRTPSNRENQNVNVIYNIYQRQHYSSSSNNNSNRRDICIKRNINICDNLNNEKSINVNESQNVKTAENCQSNTSKVSLTNAPVNSTTVSSEVPSNPISKVFSSAVTTPATADHEPTNCTTKTDTVLPNSIAKTEPVVRSASVSSKSGENLSDTAVTTDKGTPNSSDQINSVDRTSSNLTTGALPNSTKNLTGNSVIPTKETVKKTDSETVADTTSSNSVKHLSDATFNLSVDSLVSVAKLSSNCGVTSASTLSNSSDISGNVSSKLAGSTNTVESVNKSIVDCDTVSRNTKMDCDNKILADINDFSKQPVSSQQESSTKTCEVRKEILDTINPDKLLMKCQQLLEEDSRILNTQTGNEVSDRNDLENGDKYTSSSLDYKDKLLSLLSDSQDATQEDVLQTVVISDNLKKSSKEKFQSILNSDDENNDDLCIQRTSKKRRCMIIDSDSEQDVQNANSPLKRKKSTTKHRGSKPKMFFTSHSCIDTEDTNKTNTSCSSLFHSGKTLKRRLSNILDRSDDNYNSHHSSKMTKTCETNIGTPVCNSPKSINKIITQTRRSSAPTDNREIKQNKTLQIRRHSTQTAKTAENTSKASLTNVPLNSTTVPSNPISNVFSSAVTTPTKADPEPTNCTIKTDKVLPSSIAKPKPVVQAATATATQTAKGSSKASYYIDKKTCRNDLPLNEPKRRRMFAKMKTAAPQKCNTTSMGTVSNSPQEPEVCIMKNKEEPVEMKIKKDKQKMSKQPQTSLHSHTKQAPILKEIFTQEEKFQTKTLCTDVVDLEDLTSLSVIELERRSYHHEKLKSIFGNEFADEDFAASSESKRSDNKNNKTEHPFEENVPKKSSDLLRTGTESQNIPVKSKKNEECGAKKSKRDKIDIQYGVQDMCYEDMYLCLSYRTKQLDFAQVDNIVFVENNCTDTVTILESIKALNDTTIILNRLTNIMTIDLTDDSLPEDQSITMYPSEETRINDDEVAVVSACFNISTLKKDAIAPKIEDMCNSPKLEADVVNNIKDENFLNTNDSQVTNSNTNGLTQTPIENSPNVSGINSETVTIQATRHPNPEHSNTVISAHQSMSLIPRQPNPPNISRNSQMSSIFSSVNPSDQRKYQNQESSISRNSCLNHVSSTNARQQEMLSSHITKSQSVLNTTNEAHRCQNQPSGVLSTNVQLRSTPDESLKGNTNFLSRGSMDQFHNLSQTNPTTGLLLSQTANSHVAQIIQNTSSSLRTEPKRNAAGNQNTASVNSIQNQSLNFLHYGNSTNHLAPPIGNLVQNSSHVPKTYASAGSAPRMSPLTKQNLNTPNYSNQNPSRYQNTNMNVSQTTGSLVQSQIMDTASSIIRKQLGNFACSNLPQNSGGQDFSQRIAAGNINTRNSSQVDSLSALRSIRIPGQMLQRNSDATTTSRKEVYYYSSISTINQNHPPSREHTVVWKSQGIENPNLKRPTLQQPNVVSNNSIQSTSSSTFSNGNSAQLRPTGGIRQAVYPQMNITNINSSSVPNVTSEQMISGIQNSNQFVGSASQNSCLVAPGNIVSQHQRYPNRNVPNQNAAPPQLQTTSLWATERLKVISTFEKYLFLYGTAEKAWKSYTSIFKQAKVHKQLLKSEWNTLYPVLVGRIKACAEMLSVDLINYNTKSNVHVKDIYEFMLEISKIVSENLKLKTDGKHWTFFAAKHLMGLCIQNYSSSPFLTQVYRTLDSIVKLMENKAHSKVMTHVQMEQLHVQLIQYQLIEKKQKELLSRATSKNNNTHFIGTTASQCNSNQSSNQESVSNTNQHRRDSAPILSSVLNSAPGLSRPIMQAFENQRYGTPLNANCTEPIYRIKVPFVQPQRETNVTDQVSQRQISSSAQSNTNSFNVSDNVNSVGTLGLSLNYSNATLANSNTGGSAQNGQAAVNHNKVTSDIIFRSENAQNTEAANSTVESRIDSIINKTTEQTASESLNSDSGVSETEHPATETVVNVNVVATSTETENIDTSTIDLTWIDDIDMEQLQQDLQLVFVKKEEDIGEQANDRQYETMNGGYVPAISPADSGVSSPPHHPENGINTVYVNAAICVCGADASYVCFCENIHYCSSECQLNDWPTHLSVCQQIQSEKNLVK